MGNKPKDITRRFSDVAAAAQGLGLVNSQDAETIVYLAEVLVRPVVDIKAELTEHPSLKAAAGYYFRAISYAAKQCEESVDQAWHRTYNNLYATKYGSPGKSTMVLEKAADAMGKFTEKLVTAQALQDPAYASLATRASQIRHVAEQLGELRDAYFVRGRCLEQIANQVRFEKLQEEDESD